MYRRLSVMVCLVVLGLGLSGCSKCGWFWDEGGRVCRAEIPR